MLVGILGILQAGGAYVPLDPDYPDDRLGYMLQDSQAAIVLSQDKLKPRIAGIAAKHCQVVALDKQWPEISNCSAELRAGSIELQSQVRPEHLAYVIYTSGSTGKPKGVMIEHRSIVNFLCTMAYKPGIKAADSLFAVTTFCFDIAALELYLPLVTGAQIRICAQQEQRDGERLKNAI